MSTVFPKLHSFVVSLSHRFSELIIFNFSRMRKHRKRKCVNKNFSGIRKNKQQEEKERKERELEYRLPYAVFAEIRQDEINSHLKRYIWRWKSYRKYNVYILKDFLISRKNRITQLHCLAFMLCETRVLFRILKGLDLILFCDLLTSLGYDYLTHTLLIRKFTKDNKKKKKETNWKYKKAHQFRVQMKLIILDL